MNKPFVTALLVTRNEEMFIRRSLLSLINQSYPKECYEIIVVDGNSKDNTVQIVNQVVSENKACSPSISIIKNPKEILSSGWNIGIKAAKGDYVVRIDAHGEALADFIEKSVETILMNEEVCCVGGKLITKSLEGNEDIVSKVLSSPFGVGNSSFRVSDKPQYADTAVYGLYKKSVFYDLGFFDERYKRNQDIEFHARVREAGGKFFFNPEIECIYYTRNTVKKMITQSVGNGKWNMILLKNRPTAVRIRHLIPFIFVMYLIISIILGCYFHLIWLQALIVLMIHLMLGIIAARQKTNRMSELVIMPFVFLALHISYGVGYLIGIFTRLK